MHHDLAYVLSYPELEEKQKFLGEDAEDPDYNERLGDGLANEGFMSHPLVET